MSDIQKILIAHLPFLRRYARALTGSQGAGDELIRQCLEALLDDQGAALDVNNVRRELYRYFHRVFETFASLNEASRTALSPGVEGAALRQEITALSGSGVNLLAERLAELTITHRQLLLLTTVEGFSLAEASYIVDLDEAAAYEMLVSARAAMLKQQPALVLIIEDEPIIALNLCDIARDAGHLIVGVATTKTEAIKMATESHPGLVLCDIQLRDGSSGLDAAREIMDAMPVPVIFITAYPERLLTGAVREPTFLVTKPFSPDSVLVTMSQALLTQV
jgi:CheY-like chemotaxis protein/DNA-directed RNA polymerase specialized sigma24 family protein